MEKTAPILLSVIIPCYNESENIKTYTVNLFPCLDELQVDYEIVFVNDGSTDETLQELKKIKKTRMNKTHIVSYDKNKGLGGALREGITAAKGELTVTLDADLTFHPKQIKNLLNCFNKCGHDCIIGSHFLEGGTLENIPVYRIMLSKSINTIYSILLTKKIKSISSIFRLYKTRDLQQLSLSSTGFDINAEILCKLLRNKKHIIEIPATLTTRKYGTSKLKTSREVINHTKLIIKILLWQLGLQ